MGSSNQGYFVYVAGNNFCKSIGVCIVPEFLVRSKQVESSWEDMHPQDKVTIPLEFILKPIKLFYTLLFTTNVFNRIVQGIERDEGQVFAWEIEAIIPSFHKSIFGNVLFNWGILEINFIESTMVLIRLLFVAWNIVINHHVIISNAR